jgi:hypothetical protein
LITGFVPEFEVERGRRGIWLGFTAAALFVLLVSVPLVGNSYIIIDDAREQSSVRAEVERWLGDESRLVVVEMDVSGSDVTVNVFGPEPPPLAAVLRAELIDDLGNDVSVEVNWIGATTDSAGSPAE